MLGALASAKFAVPGPETKVQVPVPMLGVLPAKVVVREQTASLEPASAVVAEPNASPVIVQPLVVVRVFRALTAFVLYSLPLASSQRPEGVLGLLAQPIRVAL